MPSDRREYNQRWRQEHIETERRRSRDYYSTHKVEMQEYHRSYCIAHKNEIQQQRKGYRSRYKERRRELDHERDLELKRQFLNGVYRDICIFCKEKVLPQDLARHHINGDGNDERRVLGEVGSWRDAIEHPDPVKWATAHVSCHTRFHRPVDIREEKHP